MKVHLLVAGPEAKENKQSISPFIYVVVVVVVSPVPLQ